APGVPTLSPGRRSRWSTNEPRPGKMAVRPDGAGAWPSGKARDFGSRIRRFESSRPNPSHPAEIGEPSVVSRGSDGSPHWGSPGGRMKLDSFDRHPLLFGSSPLHPLARLTAHLGRTQIWAKREDCNSGLAFGGNK